ncbi:CaiB/BaiF CoA transferase family protein [Camelliibacillus cellulosilyticus]|uniref:CaiB/BaiF CoA transferase family protein n=1 Tax=Camelliibacillus cellulosilyticus TaxID=2174486 RepID=A0ABV9GGT5_9BACL
MREGALSGIKVIDLSRVLAGPYCTMILGDLGAEVIKVEAPGGSDDTRAWGPPFAGGESAYYLCVNRNKKAITLNLKTEAGRQILQTLTADADVVIHNFKPGTMEKWRLDYNTLKEDNPRLIYCGISGYGKTGPYKEIPGYDFVIQAMSGLMSVTGTPETGPLKVGVAITDILTGLYAANAIQAAIIERSRSGYGQDIDLSLYDCAVSAMVNVASNYLISGRVPGRLGNKHPNIVPYQTFRAQDGDMAIAVGNDRQFRKLCEILAIPELADDERFHTNPKRLENLNELETIIDRITQTQPLAFWLAKMKVAGIPSGPIQTMDQVFQDPQVVARNMKTEMNHPTAGKIPLVASPLKLSQSPVSYRHHPPLAGEHTAEILQIHGYTPEEIEKLQQDGTI